MINEVEFGKRLKSIRKARNLTQSEVSARIGVSEQAVSKWENGNCLPDIYNLKMLGRLLRVSIDSLLSDENDEQVIDTINIGSAVFEIVKKPETIYAGKIVYEDENTDIEQALEAFGEDEAARAYEAVVEPTTPITDIRLSINFWVRNARRGMGFMRETANANQHEELDIFKMPASLFIRAYTDKVTANLIAKDTCEVWELFAYIRDYFMPTHGYTMATNGAQEMEVFDTSEHTTGYTYIPVQKI